MLMVLELRLKQPCISVYITYNRDEKQSIFNIDYIFALKLESPADPKTT